MMWLILQHDKADDWVISTGKTTTIRDFLIKSFLHVGIELEFIGSGRNEKAFVKKSTNPLYKLSIGKQVVSINPNYYRPTEVDILIGDSSKAKKILGWEPQISLDELISEMMENDLSILNK